MARSYEETRQFPGSPDGLLFLLRNVGQTTLDMAVKSENPAPNGVWFRLHHGMSMTSYGEKITVTLTYLPGATQVHILSENGMPTQLVDYGRNKKNAEALFTYLQTAPRPAAAPSPVTVPAPAPRSAAAPGVRPGVKYCPACGNPGPENGAFCARCGRKL